MKKQKMTGIRCKADLFYGEGDLQINDGFYDLDPLMKVDLLGDWYGQIKSLYEDHLEDWRIWLETHPPKEV